jgi:hypothetical protein
MQGHARRWRWRPRREVLISSAPVVHPRALARSTVVGWADQGCEALQLTSRPCSLVTDEPDTALGRLDLTTAVAANTAAGAVAQLLRTRHRTGVAGVRQRAFAALHATEGGRLGRALDRGEHAVGVVVNAKLASDATPQTVRCGDPAESIAEPGGKARRKGTTGLASRLVARHVPRGRPRSAGRPPARCAPRGGRGRGGRSGRSWRSGGRSGGAGRGP